MPLTIRLDSTLAAEEAATEEVVAEAEGTTIARVVAEGTMAETITNRTMEEDILAIKEATEEITITVEEEDSILVREEEASLISEEVGDRTIDKEEEVITEDLGVNRIIEMISEMMEVEQETSATIEISKEIPILADSVSRLKEVIVELIETSEETRLALTLKVKETEEEVVTEAEATKILEVLLQGLVRKIIPEEGTEEAVAEIPGTTLEEAIKVATEEADTIIKIRQTITGMATIRRVKIRRAEAGWRSEAKVETTVVDSAVEATKTAASASRTAVLATRGTRETRTTIDEAASTPLSARTPAFRTRAPLEEAEPINTLLKVVPLGSTPASRTKAEEQTMTTEATKATGTTEEEGTPGQAGNKAAEEVEASASHSLSKAEGIKEAKEDIREEDTKEETMEEEIETMIQVEAWLHSKLKLLQPQWSAVPINQCR